MESSNGRKIAVAGKKVYTQLESATSGQLRGRPHNLEKDDGKFYFSIELLSMKEIQKKLDDKKDEPKNLIFNVEYYD